MSNIIYLDAYRKDCVEEETEIHDPVILGWDDNGHLHITSTVDTEECLWMIDLAKKIMENRPPDIINNE